MRHKIASAFVVFFCLLLILVVFFADSVSFGVKVFMAIIAVILLSVVYQSTQKGSKRSGIKNLTKAEGQKVIDDNIHWIRKRWNRVQKEKDSGVLRTVDWWYFDEATERQLSRINRIGLNLSTVKVTKGQASDIIGLYEPAEEKNITILKRNNIPLDGMNQTKARELVATLRYDPEPSNKGIEHTTENLIIKQLPKDFIYFVRFFDSGARYDEASPVYVPKDDHYRLRYDQAALLGLARKGVEIPLKEKLKTLKLKQLSSLAGGQKFTRKAPAIELLMDIPDLVDRFESMAPIEDWFQLKKVKLDVEYLENKWTELYSDDY